MCQIDWGLVASVITALASVGVLVVAIIALRSWRNQLRGTAKHSVAQETATAARALKYAFYSARSPLIEPWEFPEDYWSPGGGVRARTNVEKANAFQYVYFGRKKELWPYLKSLIDLRPKCGAVLGEDVAKAIEELAKKARELQFFMDQQVDQMRAGEEIVRGWGDQDFIEKVKASVKVDGGRDDDFSIEFEEDLKELLELVRPHF